jgi:primosomal protein N'
VRYYQNPRTREKFETVDACRNCGGWRIKELGISTTGMKKYLEKVMPQYAESLYIIDSTETATHPKTKKLIEAWQEQKGILVTTEKSLPYLIGRDVSAVVMASLESLLASPVYTAHERLARLMLGFADIAKDHAIVQVRDTTVPVLEGFKQKNLADWYHSELTDRESFKYPPFYVHIRIETIGTKDAITKREALVTTLFGDVLQVKNIYQSTSSEKTAYRMVVGIVLEHASWASLPLQKSISPIYMDIFNKLQSLPEHFTIAVNPSSFNS